MTDQPAADQPLIIVNSGAYTSQELVAEFGALPPAFLPIGHGRLYERQARLFDPLAASLHLTVPESFDLPVWDAERLATLGYVVVRTPDELSLGAALLYTLGHLGFRDRPLRILHGDTLVEGIDLAADDVMAVAAGGDGYRWGAVELGANGTVGRVSGPGQAPPGSHLRLCGYFAFGSAARFAESLALAGGDFYGALNRQAALSPSRPIEPSRWLDFGHVQTFFRSRRIVTTERAFNSLDIGEMHVRKHSVSAAGKLRAEARWLREVPPTVAPFCARVLHEGEEGGGYFYDSEYEFMPTLAELYVFGRVALPAWVRILQSCANFIDASVQAGAPTPCGLLNSLVVDKTADRLGRFAHMAGLNLDAPTALDGAPAPSLRRCLADIETALAGCGDRPSFMHGDFCFSNILYSFRTDRIRLIDPRAISERGEYSPLGDMRYDLAKLMHSACGRYDLILAGQYAGGRTGAQSFELSFPPEALRTQVEAYARSLAIAGTRLDSSVVWASMISLFLSMPPLHADRPDRQSAFIANALRLHRDWERGAGH